MTPYRNTNIEMVVYVYGALHKILQDDTLTPVVREEVMQSIRYMEIIGSQLSVLEDEDVGGLGLYNLN